MAPSRPLSNGRSPLVRKQSQITTFFSPGKTLDLENITSPKEKDSSSETVSPKRKKNKPSNVDLTPELPAKPDSPSSGVKLREEAVGRRLRVFWPLDKTWYEGQIKSFDSEAGKHVVQYDDAEEEVLDLGAEQIQWIEETPRSFRRLRRRISASGTILSGASSDKDSNESSIGGEEDSGDEDWGEGAGENGDDDSMEMELEEIDEEDREGIAGLRRSKNAASRKRKMGDFKKDDSTRKEGSERISEKFLSVSPVGGNLVFGAKTNVDSEYHEPKLLIDLCHFFCCELGYLLL